MAEPIEGWLTVIEDDFRTGRGCATADGLELVAEVRRLRDYLREKNEIIRAFAGPAAQTPEDVAAMRDRLAGAQALIARMLPLVDHDSRAGCPMAFHRSDGEQCTCGALDVVAQAREVASDV